MILEPYPSPCKPRLLICVLSNADDSIPDDLREKIKHALEIHTLKIDDFELGIDLHCIEDGQTVKVFQHQPVPTFHIRDTLDNKVAACFEELARLTEKEQRVVGFNLLLIEPTSDYENVVMACEICNAHPISLRTQYTRDINQSLPKGRVVKVTIMGKVERNQEIVLRAIKQLRNMKESGINPCGKEVE